MHAASYGNDECLPTLIKAKADLNLQAKVRLSEGVDVYRVVCGDYNAA